jgi:hypothetical protein
MTTPDWRAELPEQWTVRVRGEDGTEREIPIREHPALAKYASKDEAVKALVHAQRLIGMRPEDMDGVLRVPASDAGPEQWDRVWTALGRPEKPEGYRLPELDLPDDLDIDEDLRAEFLARSHALGLTPDQVAGLYAWFLPLSAAYAQQVEDDAAHRHRRSFETLRGLHRGETPRVLEDARLAALALGGEDLLDALEESGAGDSPEVIQALARVAPLVLEPGLRRGRGAGAPGREALREMMRDPRYWDPTRRDPAWVDEVKRGFERLYPGEYQPGGLRG